MLFVSSVLVENISLIFISVYRATPALTRGLGFCGLIPGRGKHTLALINTMIITHTGSLLSTCQRAFSR